MGIPICRLFDDGHSDWCEVIPHCSSLFFFFLFKALLKHMEVSRLGVELELWLLAYTTVTVTQNLSLACNLYHSSRQRRILNPLSKAGDRTRDLMVPSRIH